MTDNGWMRGRLLQAVLATVVVGLVLSLLAAAFARSGEERAQIEQADEAGRQLVSEVDAFVAKAGAAITRRHDKQPSDYAGLLKLVTKRLAKAPEVDVESTTAYGRDNSRTYSSAVERRALVLQPFRDLEATLERQSVPQNDFVKSGKELVEISTARLLDEVQITGGQVLLDVVLPVYEAARADFAEQVVPPGQELLGLDVATFADEAVNETKQGAAKIDAGEPFFFNFGERREKLYARLTTFEAQVAATVGQRINDISAGSDN